MASIRFEIRAGRLTRRAVRRELRALAYAVDVTLSIDEDRGWLSSQYLCEARGTDDAIVEFRDRYLEWLSAVGADGSEAL
jgi:hypothetical protein